LAQLRTDIVAEITAALREGVLDSANATAMLQRMVENLLDYAREHPNAVAFSLTGPLPVPQSLQTVVTLLAAQQQIVTPVEQVTPAIWTFLLGTLLRVPYTEIDEAWVTAQLLALLGK